MPALGALVAALSLASPASGASVRIVQVADPNCWDGHTYPELVYKGGLGEANKLSIVTVGAGFVQDPGLSECVQNPDGGYSTNLDEIVSDPGAKRIYAGKGCVADSKTVADCGGVWAVSVNLGDHNDSLAIDAFLDGSTIFGGAGNDKIRTINGAPDSVSCGVGTDSVQSDGDQIAADCENSIP